MTTYDAQGRMTSCFIPPMHNGRVLSYDEWKMWAEDDWRVLLGWNLARAAWMAAGRPWGTGP